jgi:hypothetical protein
VADDVAPDGDSTVERRPDCFAALRTAYRTNNLTRSVRRDRQASRSYLVLEVLV